MGPDISKRSPIAGGLFTLVGKGGDAAAEEKSPKSPPKDSFRGAGIGGDVGLGGGAGLASKKEPPLSEDLVAEGCLVWPVGEVRPANGDGLD